MHRLYVCPFIGRPSLVDSGGNADTCRPPRSHVVHRTEVTRARPRPGPVGAAAQRGRASIQASRAGAEAAGQGSGQVGQGRPWRLGKGLGKGRTSPARCSRRLRRDWARLWRCAGRLLACGGLPHGLCAAMLARNDLLPTVSAPGTRPTPARIDPREVAEGDGSEDRPVETLRGTAPFRLAPRRHPGHHPPPLACTPGAGSPRTSLSSRS